MHDHPTYHPNTGSGPGPETVQTLMRLATALAFCSLLAATAPHGLALATLGSLLNLCAIAASAVAFFVHDQPFAAHLTRWDEAAVLVLLSMLANWMVDPEAVRAALEAARVLGN